MAGYLTPAQFALRTVCPDRYLDEIEGRQPGWLQQQLDQVSAQIDARLRKRYAAPFALPYPEAVLDWLARIVTVRAYHRRGVDPTDEQYSDARDDAKAASAEVLEAADGNTGLWDLPLRQDTTATGISKGGPLAYTEVSPYTWSGVQRDEALDE